MTSEKTTDMATFASVPKGEAGLQRLFDLYRKHGAADYIGEPISQTAHACQAGMLAELEGADPAGERPILETRIAPLPVSAPVYHWSLKPCAQRCCHLVLAARLSVVESVKPVVSQNRFEN